MIRKHDIAAKDNPVAGQQCRYCGAPATDIDHVPPTSLLKRWRLPWPQQLVPACDFCNRTLSNRAALMTLPTRIAWMKMALWRKYQPHKRREKYFNAKEVMKNLLPLILALVATPALARPTVTFPASPDHEALTRYELIVEGGLETQKYDLGLPPVHEGQINIELPQLPKGQYIARVAAVNEYGEGVSEPSQPFSLGSGTCEGKRQVVWFPEGQAWTRPGMERTAWLGIINPLEYGQEVRVELMAGGGAMVRHVYVGPRRREVFEIGHLFGIADVAFGLEVELEIGAVSLVMWDRSFSTPNVSVPTVACK